MLHRFRFVHIRAEVDPHQVSALKIGYFHFRQFSLESVAQISEVPLDYPEELIEPRSAVLVCCFHGDVSECVAPGDPDSCSESVPLLTELFVRDYHYGILYGSKIEGLCCCGQCDHDVIVSTCCFTCRCRRYVLVAAHDDVMVDLVGDHIHVMPFADIQHAADLVPLPYAPYRIVRRAEYECLYVFADDCLLKGLVVHLISVFRAQQRAVHQTPAVVFYRHHERIVDRLHHRYSLAFSGQKLNEPVECRNDARCKAHPFTLHFVAVILFLPFNECIIVSCRRDVVAESAHIDILFQRISYAFRYLKIHVRDPHRKQVTPAERLFKSIPLCTVSVLSVYVFDQIH